MQRIALLVIVAAAACDRKKATSPEPAAVRPPAVAPRGALGGEPGVADPAMDDDGAAPAEPQPPAHPPAQPPAQPPGDGPEFDLRPVRTFGALDGITPSQDGDMLIGNGCNTLYKTTPYEAVFVFCNDELVAGPLTTPEQIRDVFAQINQSQASAFEIGRSIRARWPTGCANCRYRIYDRHGNHIRNE